MHEGGELLVGLGRHAQHQRVSFDESGDAHAAGMAVDLWRIESCAEPSHRMILESVLDPEERERARRFRFERDRLLFVTSHGARRIVLGAMSNVPPRDLRFRRSEHGKPHLEPAWPAPTLEFSQSHSGVVVLIAVALGRPIGVDVECVDPAGGIHEVAEKILGSRERLEVESLPAEERLGALFRVWSRKEAALKAVGCGLDVSMSAFEVGTSPSSRRRDVVVPWSGSNSRRVVVRDVDCGLGYAGALAATKSVGERI